MKGTEQNLFPNERKQKIRNRSKLDFWQNSRGSLDKYFRLSIMLQYSQKGYYQKIYQSIFCWNKFRMNHGFQQGVTFDLVTQGQKQNHCFTEFIGSDSTDNRVGIWIPNFSIYMSKERSTSLVSNKISLVQIRISNKDL